MMYSSVFIRWWSSLCGKFCSYTAQNKLTALIWAAKSGHADLVRLLLDAGVDKNAKDDVRLGGGATGLVWIFGLDLWLGSLAWVFGLGLWFDDDRKYLRIVKIIRCNYVYIYIRLHAIVVGGCGTFKFCSRTRRKK
jgi:hypothetical protein